MPSLCSFGKKIFRTVVSTKDVTVHLENPRFVNIDFLSCFNGEEEQQTTESTEINI